MILPVVMMAKVSGTVRKVIERKFGVDCMREPDYRSWVQRTRWLYGRQMTNGLAVWDEIIQRIVGKGG